MSWVIPRLALVRAIWLMCLFALLCDSAAGAGITAQSKLTAILVRSPDAQLVPVGQELKTAERMAARVVDAIAYLGIGGSMEPLYASNTAVVVVPIDYDRIKNGMTVVYLNCDGQRVAHCVVGETRDGYLVQGVSNEKADSEVVTKDNLIGVIIQAFASGPTGFHHELTHRFMRKDQLSAKILRYKS